MKGTACAEGRPDPGEAEQLGFAVDGKVRKCNSKLKQPEHCLVYNEFSLASRDDVHWS